MFYANILSKVWKYGNKRINEWTPLKVNIRIHVSYFYRKLLSLVVLAKNNNKCNGLYDNQCEIKQVFISNHFTTPFVLNFWGSVRGEAPSAVVVSLPGLVTVFRIPYSGTMRNLFIRKNNKIHLAKMRWM